MTQGYKKESLSFDLPPPAQRIPYVGDVWTREQINASIEADRKLAHEWIRPSLGLPEDAPYRFDHYAQEIESLRSALQSQDREDAERYRTIRDSPGFSLNGHEGIGRFHVSQKTEPGVAMYLYGEYLDSAIDHARRIEGEGK